MSGCIVMAIALAGLGGHNQPGTLTPLPSSPDALVGTVTSSDSLHFTPYSYSGYYARAGAYEARRAGYEFPEYMSPWGTIRSTLWSLILGRDPDVPTPAEIDASVYGNAPSH